MKIRIAILAACAAMPTFAPAAFASNQPIPGIDVVVHRHCPPDCKFKQPATTGNKGTKTDKANKTQNLPAKR